MSKEFIKIPSPNFSNRTLPISMLVFHYTEIEHDEDAIHVLTNSSSKKPVSAHYLVGEKGNIYQLVDECKRAWHAGVSYWRGVTDVNSASIGIEISSKGRDIFGKAIPYDDAVITSLQTLTKDIIRRHNIRSYNVVGHSDVAPLRKSDPGELFPWKELASNGIGFWTDDFIKPTVPIEIMLSKIGYNTSNINAAITAFQRHYYQEAFFDNKAIYTIERLAAIYHNLKTKTSIYSTKS